MISADARVLPPQPESTPAGFGLAAPGRRAHQLVLAAGWIAHVHDPTPFTVLFVLDALTFLAYIVVLAFVRDPGVRAHEEGETRASYLAVVRDRTFLGLWALNFMFVAAGYSLFNLL